MAASRQPWCGCPGRAGERGTCPRRSKDQVSFGLKLLGPDIAYLVITSTEHEFGVGVVVQDPLDDLALVHGERAHLEVLLPNED